MKGENEMEYMDPQRLARFKDRLAAIVKQDLRTVIKKDSDYGGSWKKYGGVGAYFNVARKWDRIENMVNGLSDNVLESTNMPAPQYDLFGHIEADPSGDGLIESVRDLRGYLLLVEEELMEKNIVADDYTANIPKREDS